MKISKTNILIFHGILGILLWKFSFLSTYYGLIVILLGTYFILSRPDSLGNLPLLFSGYMVGIEVLLRMTKANLFWEFGKYAVIYFILLGIIRRSNKILLYTPIVYYFLLLLPSIILIPIQSFNLWRQDLAFNLSGPAILVLSSIFFFNTTIDRNTLRKLLFIMLLPIISMSTYNLINMPDLATYNFLPYSDSTTSGGYGPNQVSTLFGLGIVIILTSQVLKLNIFQNNYIYFTLLSLFLGLGLITFSRGGILSAIISITIAISYYMYRDQKIIQMISKGFTLTILVLIIWFTLVSITDGVISNRYGFGDIYYSDRFFLDLTGRAQIYYIDLEIFFDNLFTGVGPGQASELRYKYGYGSIVAAHTEYSRMVAEHGILGVFSLLILISLPINKILKTHYNYGKFVMIIFGCLALLTLSHSAMRLAMPGFLYGLIFPKYDE